MVDDANVQPATDVLVNGFVAVRKQSPIFAVPNVSDLDTFDGPAMVFALALTLNHGQPTAQQFVPPKSDGSC